MLLAGFPWPGAPSASAGELEDKRRELDRVNKEIEKYKLAISKTQGQEKSLLAELRKLELQLEQAQNDLRYLEARLQATQRSIEETEKSIKETEDALTRRKELLAGRARWLYKVGPMGYLEVILGAASVQDFLGRLEIVRAIMSRDVALAAGLKADREDLEEERATLEERRAQLASLKSQTALKKEQVTSRAAEREMFLAKVKKERSEYEKALDELEELSERLVEIIKDLQAKQAYRPGGPVNMVWPAKGGVTSGFGMRRHPILRTFRMHSGVDIAAPRGAAVAAAEAGIVLHSGVLGGYGKTVIIDHGGGVSTLYAHCDTLYVGEGQTVTRGQTIARVGSTGLSTGPHLHFEVRVNGAPKDPLAWVK
jgi:murein DD-endopeptidase MepM/ murein hydrolase activator NlpD